MFTAGIKCTEDELNILEKRLMNVNGFNYLELMKIIKAVDENIKRCSINKVPKEKVVCIKVPLLHVFTRLFRIIKDMSIKL